jgi:hypothetical protein
MRYQSYGKLDTQIQADGDVVFKGIDMRRDRGILAPGMVTRSENKRMWTGRAETRGGMADAIDFNPAFESLIVGTGVYQNTAMGGEWLLIATQNSSYVWACQDGHDPVKIDISDPDNTTVGPGPVEFSQSFTKVRLHRRPITTYLPVEWDGDPSHSFDVIFASQTSGSLVIDQRYIITNFVAGDDFTNVGAASNATGVIFQATGTTPTTWTNGSKLTLYPPVGSGPTPNTFNGEPFENRLLLYNPRQELVQLEIGRDQFIMTDVLDGTAYDPILGVFNVESARADIITRLWPYFKQGVVVFMKKSIALVTNFTIDPFLTEQQLLNSKIGCMAEKGVVLIGADTLFLSEPGGIYRLSEVIQQRITTEPVPVSEPIDDIIKRIEWQYAFLPWVVAAVTCGDYAYFAVPIDQAAGGSNVLLVYNTVSKMWESVDTWPDSDFRINAMHVLQVQGDQSVLAIDFFNRRVVELNTDSLSDVISGEDFPIQDVIETRGYNLGNPFGFKRYQRMTLSIRTFDPSIKITALRDGYNDEIELTNGDLTKDHLKFYKAEHKDFNPLTDDPNEPLREDYSQGSGSNDYIVEDFDDWPAGPIDTLPASLEDSVGANKQESLERFAVGTMAKALALRIENSQGQCDLLSVSVEGRPIEETVKVIA